MARLDPEYKSFFEETDRLLALLSSISAMAALHRKLIAEIVHLRLTILLENHMKTIFSKLCCGASYIDGTDPLLLLAPLKSAAAAVSAMQTFNRAKPIQLSWNDGPKIRDSMQHLLDPLDHSISVVRNFGAHFTEMRYIRNHITHKNEGTRTNFRKLVQSYYGANVPGITSGVLLLSERVSKPPLIEVHIRKSRTLIKDILKA
jgi:hypothetical protein